ncbi:MAG: 4-(cytidine 5'-diphospho)-2-C-methyl-D-erythritol kinase, partial [Actinobacteria bacterium]|nr:4-(cytidine 5'-diphospho)-2-C-methyl-D-erythritol kinase [Actinomycetota bacterium]
RAKINLYLGVGALRGDGYHEVRSIMQSLDLCDELYFRRTEGSSNEVKIRCNDRNVPADDTNLVSRAVNVFLENTGLAHVGGFEVLINKKIPVAAGLAGGSADAAAALLAMDHIFETEMERESLLDMAEMLGSDVPFCLLGGTAVASGRGERLKKIPDLPPLQVVLASPGLSVDTRDVYDRFDKAGESDKQDSSQLEQSVDNLVLSLERHDFDYAFENLYNSLEFVTTAVDEVAELKEAALQAGAKAALMTGSGPTVFALVSGFEKAADVAWELEKCAPVTIVTSFADKGAEVSKLI